MTVNNDPRTTRSIADGRSGASHLANPRATTSTKQKPTLTQRFIGLEVSGRAPTWDAGGYIPLGGQGGDRGRFDHSEVVGWRGRIDVFLSNIRVLSSTLIQRAHARLRPSPLVHEILRECCSLPRRIRMTLETKPYLYGLRFGPAAHDLWRVRNHEQIRACIRDMRDIAKSRPLATYQDRQLFVEGWQSGAKWALGGTHTLGPG